MAEAKKKIVEIPFFCNKSKKAYKKGAEYKGKRTDLKHLFVGYKAPGKAKIETK